MFLSKAVNKFIKDNRPEWPETVTLDELLVAARRQGWRRLFWPGLIGRVVLKKKDGGTFAVHLQQHNLVEVERSSYLERDYLTLSPKAVQYRLSWIGRVVIKAVDLPVPAEVIEEYRAEKARYDELHEFVTGHCNCCGQIQSIELPKDRPSDTHRTFLCHCFMCGGGVYT